MPLIWLSVVCAAIMVILLMLGERTLPLFGNDRALAERSYKTIFLLLTTGVVAGLVPAFFRYMAAFGHARAEAEGRFPPFLRVLVAVFENAGPWLSALIGIAGVALAVETWRAG